MTNDETRNMSRSRILVAGFVGNVMEWYDFAVYGYFASVIGHLFFPSEDPSVSLIAAFGAFAAGFLVRPLGGMLFGHIADVVGRKHALSLSVVAMAVPTVTIGLLPTYEMIGIAAPIAIVALRILQGLSVGGEYTCSLVFLAEHAPKDRRAVFASSGIVGGVFGILLGSAIGAVLTSILDSPELLQWGWRIPFLIGALVALSGYLVRRALHVEPPPPGSKNPVKDVFAKHLRPVLIACALNVGVAIAFYTAFVYAVTYIKEIDDLPARIAFNLNTAAMALLLLLTPISAWLADKLGRRTMRIAGSLLLLFGAIPFFHLMHSSDQTTVFLGEIGFVFAVAVNAGALIGGMEIIPKSVRCTGFALAYNGAMGYFGGTTPLIAAWLIVALGDPIAPAYWVCLGAAISLIAAVFFTKETKDLGLD